MNKEGLISNNSVDIDVSIIMVNYKTPDLTDICIGSILKFTKDITYEIIVIDNNSEDNSEELICGKYPQVKWINSGFNAGTSIAYNIGIRASNGKYLIIQNSDTEYVENTVLLSYNRYRELEQKMKIGLLGCQIVGYDKIIQFNSNRSFFSIRNYLAANPIFIKLNWLQGKLDKSSLTAIHSEDHISTWLGIPFGIFNANICKNKSLYFDEDIFMYCDDQEWCYRLAQYGYTHYFSVCTKILHWNGGSSINTFSSWRHGQINLSRWVCFIKTRGKFYYAIALLILLMNFIMDEIFYSKAKFSNQIKELHIQSRKARLLQWYVYKKYALHLLLYFHKRTSSSGKFAKFEMNKS
jgi:GT2 family glycosyltransferase